MKHNKFIVSCDWFAYSCLCSHSWPTMGGTISYKSRSFIIEGTNEHHPFFHESALVREGSNEIAIIFYRCKRFEKSLRESCQIKVCNSRLYFSNWHTDLMDVIHALQWRVHHINRVDICADCNEFANGRLPLRFVQDYMASATKSRSTYIRCGSNKFRAYGTKSLDGLTFETLSWGTRDAPIQVNLYNKSVELQSKDKPWIRNRWELGGLRHGKDEHGVMRHVWRAEISITPSQITWIDKKLKQNGKKVKQVCDKVSELSISDFCTTNALAQTWMLLIPSYFSFREQSHDAFMKRTSVRSLPLITLYNSADFDATSLPLRSAVGLKYMRKTTRHERQLFDFLVKLRSELQLDATEKDAWMKVQTKLATVLQMPCENLADDAITQFLVSCFRDFGRVESPIYTREAKRIVQMLRGAKDENMLAWMHAVQSYEEMIGDSIFEEMLKHANDIGADYLPDEVVADFVDEDVEQSILESYYKDDTSDSDVYPWD